MQSPIFRGPPLSIGDMLDWAIRLYRARFGKLILTTSIFLVPLGLLSGIISGQTMTSYLNIFLTALQNPEAVAEPELLSQFQGNSALLTLSYLLMPIGIAVNGLVTLALTRQLMAIVHYEELGIGASIRLGLSRFWGWVGMTFAIYAAYAGVALLVFIAFFIILFFLAFAAFGLAAFEGAAQGGDPGTLAVVGMMVGLLCLYGGGLIAAMAPFLYLSTRWAVALPVLVDQGVGPLEALSESWKLTKGHVRRALGYVVLLYLFYGLLYLALMTVAFAASGLVFTKSMVASVAIFGIVGALLPVLWQPIAVAAYVILYYDLRMRNQGYDLELRIQALETEVERAAYTAV